MSAWIRRKRILLSTATLLGTVIGYGRTVYAQSCSGGPNSYTCEGTGTTDLSFSGTNISVTTVPGRDFGVNATGADAVSITGDGALSFDDTAANPGSYLYSNDFGLYMRNDGPTAGDVTINSQSTIRGGNRGINADHNGNGALQITTTGAVTGTDEFGIVAYSRTNSTGQTIRADGTVTGYRAGIQGNHEGTGDLSITANGDAIATGRGGPYQGIAAYTDLNASNLTIDAVNAEGSEGIRAYHAGSGYMRITTTGTVTGVDGDGILAAALERQTGAMTIETAAVTGGVSGIVADHYYGTGALSITATGTVTSTGTDSYDSGILAIGGTDTTSVTVRAAAVSGESRGISAEHMGSGPLSIETNGDVKGGTKGIYASHTGTGATNITAIGAVEGTDEEGILAFGDVDTNGMTINAAKVTGGTRGINVYNFGTGATNITATGDVEGVNEGIVAFGYVNTLGMTIRAARVTGLNAGINADHDGGGALAITATGAVTGTNAYGINAYSGPSSTGQTIRTYDTVRGYTAISSRHSGTGVLFIQAKGDVSATPGGDQGIAAYSYDSTSGLTIETSGAVVGHTDGIYASNTGTGRTRITVNAGSSITSTGADVDDVAIESNYASTTLTVGGTLNGGAGGAVLFDQNVTFNDRLELRPTAEVTGNVRAGPGTDTLAFGGAGDGSFNLSNIDTTPTAPSQQFQSFETFRLESGTWAFSGATTAPFMQTGGTLAGNPTFGGLAVQGGTVAPGSSFGTVTVNGAFSMAAASTLEIEVDAAGNTDKVVVNGTVDLTGATLRVLAERGDYDLTTEYTIVENDGSDPVRGRFGSVLSNLAFLIPTVDYAGGTGNDVVLTLERNDTLLQDVAKTKNEKAVAAALDAFPTDNALLLAVLNQTDSGARQAFNALSGEIHATVAGTLVDDSRYTREAVMDRLMQASHTNGALGNGGPQVASYDDGAMRLAGAYDGKSLVDVPMAPAQPLAFWTQGFGAWGTFDGDGNAATADRNLGGFISGMDADIGPMLGDTFGGTWRAGIAMGASFSDVSVDQRYSGANTKTYHLGGYVGGDIGGFALRGGGLWAWSDIETSRAVVFPNFFERQKADYDADTGQLFGEIAYPTQMGGIALEPFAGLAFVSVESGSFHEIGGPQASLRTGGFDQDVGYTTLGLRAATTMYWGEMAVTPHIEAAWLHAFDDVTPGASLAFATTGIGFAVDGVPLAEDSALLDAGLDFALSDRLSAGFSYQGQYADSVSDNAVKGRFTWLFN